MARKLEIVGSEVGESSTETAQDLSPQILSSGTLLVRTNAKGKPRMLIFPEWIRTIYENEKGITFVEYDDVSLEVCHKMEEFIQLFNQPIEE